MKRHIHYHLLSVSALLIFISLFSSCTTDEGNPTDVTDLTMSITTSTATKDGTATLPTERQQSSEVSTTDLTTEEINQTSAQRAVNGIPLPAGIDENIFMPKKEDLKKLKEEADPYHPEFIDTRIWYEDKNKNAFGFDKKSGELTMIDMNLPDPYLEIAEKDKLSEEELWKIADAIASELLDIRQYAYRSVIPSEYHTSFGYQRVIQGYKTTETVSVSLTFSGEFRSISIFGKNQFEDINIPKIDEKKLDSKFETLLKKQYGDIMQDYEIQKRSLDLKDGNLIMKYSFILIRHGGIKSGEILEIPVS